MAWQGAARNVRAQLGMAGEVCYGVFRHGKSRSCEVRSVKAWQERRGKAGWGRLGELSLGKVS